MVGRERDRQLVAFLLEGLALGERPGHALPTPERRLLDWRLLGRPLRLPRRDHPPGMGSPILGADALPAGFPACLTANRATLSPLSSKVVEDGVGEGSLLGHDSEQHSTDSI